jgi:hypothetical protein
MCFFPLMVVIFLLSPSGRIAKQAIVPWLPSDYLQRLGFLNSPQYFKEAQKHGVLERRVHKRVDLSLKWLRFVRPVLLEFEKSTDQDMEQLLRAIVRIYLALLLVARCAELLYRS